MEHVLLPQNSRPTVIDVPCICDPSAYDGEPGQFPTYPASKGRRHFSWTGNSGSYRRQLQDFGRQHVLRTHESQAFLQQWLFFGFLKEIFVEVLDLDFDPMEFIRQEGGNRFITTASLHDVFAKFSNPPDDAVLYEDVHKCMQTYLKYTEDCMTIILSAVKIAQPLDGRITLSILSTAETVAKAIYWITDIQWRRAKIKFEQSQSAGTPRDAFGLEPPEPILVAHADLMFATEEIVRHMRTAGWCPTEIPAVLKRFPTIEGAVAISAMDRPRLGNDHENCNERCQWSHINRDHYKPRHDCPGKNCPLYESDDLNNTIRSILQSNSESIPVLKISEHNGSLHVTAVRAAENVKYIALSHVWADGLGNKKNALPECQLLRLSGLMDRMAEKAKTAEDAQIAENTEMYIWIDTLCCPCDEATQKLALNRMPQTYTNATYVLVLDSTFETLPLIENYEWEALLRVFTSRWVTRLWTAQEGILARSLWFQFLNGAEDLATLMYKVQGQAVGDSRVRDMLIYFQVQAMGLEAKRNPVRRESVRSIGLQKAAEALVMLHISLQDRLVSCPADEPLCVGTLLGLPLQDGIMREGDRSDSPRLAEDRMCRMWTLFASKYDGIPIGLLGIGHPRIDEPGFRWAPKTVLTRLPDTKWRRYLQLKGTGSITRNGLRLRMEGLKITRNNRRDGLARHPWRPLTHEFHPTFPFRMKSSVFWDQSDGSFYEFVIDKEHSRSLSKDQEHLGFDFFDEDQCALLLIEPPTDGAPRDALLGRLASLEDGSFLLTKFSPVFLCKMPAEQNLVFKTAERIATTVRNKQCTRDLDRLQSAGDTSSERFLELARQIKGAMYVEATEHLRDEWISNALETAYPGCGSEQLCFLALDWFHHDYVGERLGDDTQWYVD